MTTTLPPFELTPALEQALLVKFAAETAVSVEEQKIKAAEAVRAKSYAEYQEANTRLALRQEAAALAGDFYHHQYLFDTEVCEQSAYACVSQLDTWHRQEPECDMHLVFNSPGGDVVWGMHLFDQITSYSLREGGSHKVTITVRGMAASMAGILLQAADERVIGARASVLIHQVSAWAGGSLGEIKDRVKWLDQVTDQVAEIFLSRSEGKISPEDFEKGWSRRDWWLTAQQAYDLGFVDRIDGRRPVE